MRPLRTGTVDGTTERTSAPPGAATQGRERLAVDPVGVDS
jgi:hypothetical protein